MKRLICIFIWIGFLSLSFANNTIPESLVSIQELSHKPLLIDYGYIQNWAVSNNGKEKADKNLYKLESFTRLKSGQDQFSYYILEELNWNNSFKSFLIYEDYESESAIWLANYDTDYNLIDTLEIFYDNAEGAWTTTSKIYRDQNLIELTQYDAYATPEISVRNARVTSNGKIEK